VCPVGAWHKNRTVRSCANVCWAPTASARKAVAISTAFFISILLSGFGQAQVPGCANLRPRKRFQTDIRQMAVGSSPICDRFVFPASRKRSPNRGPLAGERRGAPKIVDGHMAGEIAIDPLITHTLKLEDINKGFEITREGKGIRSVVAYQACKCRCLVRAS
jgi:hypothetical protein